MDKIWIECQKCGSIFWVFSDEVNAIYPKRHLNYQICSGCEQKIKSEQLKLIDLIEIKEQIGFYYLIIKIFFYFCIGAIALIILKKLKDFLNFFSNKFDRSFFYETFKKILNLSIFIIISIFIGWFIIQISTTEPFSFDS